MNVNTLFSKEMTHKYFLGDCEPDYGTIWYNDLFIREKVRVINEPYVDTLRGQSGYWSGGRGESGKKYIIHWEILADTFDNGLPDEQCCDWERYAIYTEQEFYE